MTRRRLPLLLVFALPLGLSACGITDWADQHMPVIGERCEHWQCFTESGQEESRLNQQETAQGGTSQSARKPIAENPPATYPQPQAAAPVAQTTAAAPAATPPLAPPMPASGAYVYVPRAPAEPGTSPFDNQSSR